MPRLVKDGLLPCHYKNNLNPDCPPCSWGITQWVEGFYKLHQKGQLPPSGHDAVFLCDADADWHSGRCYECAPRPVRV